MKYTGTSEVGLYRNENQDRIAVVEKDNALLAILCDGIGGGNAGSIASRMVATLLQEAFLETENVHNTEEAREWFSKTIVAINRSVFHESLVEPRYKGMGTTLVACFIFAEEAIAFNIGDSRLYHYTNGSLQALSHDQTYAYEMYLRNEIAFEDLAAHPKRNVLMNAVGIDDRISFETIEIPSDWHYLLLSSDGLHDYVAHEAIESSLGMPDILEIRNRLVTLAYEAGGFDNVSVILIEGDHHE